MPKSAIAGNKKYEQRTCVVAEIESIVGPNYVKIVILILHGIKEQLFQQETDT